MVLFLERLRAFQNSTANMGTLYLCALFLYLYHQVNFSFAFNLQYYQSPEPFGAYSIENLVPKSLGIFGYIIISIVATLSLISIFFNDLRSTGFKYLLSWVGHKIFPYLRLVIEGNVILAAFFMLIQDQIFILFALTLVISLFASMFLENFLISKDTLRCGNRTFNILWKIAVFSNLAINKFGMMYQSESLYNSFIGIRCLVSWGVWVSYLSFGFDIYAHQTQKYLFMLIIVGFVSLSTGQFVDQMGYLLKLHDQIYDLQYFGTIFIPMFIITAIADWQRKWRVFDDENGKVKVKTFYLREWGSQQNVEAQCFFRGLVLNHVSSGCSNPQCYSHQASPFDSKKNKYCNIQKIMVSKHSFENFLNKCWYTWSDRTLSVEQSLDYAEYLFMQEHKIYKAYHKLQECQTKTLFPIDKLRIHRLQQQMREKSDSIIRELYNSELDIEIVIKNQRTFQNIQEMVLQIITKTLQFWKTVNYNKVNLTDLINIVEPIFKAMDSVNDGWKELAHYLDQQNKWKFFYAWYLLYVKNEKLPPSFLELFSDSVKEKFIFGTPEDAEDRGELKFQENQIIVHTDSDSINTKIIKVNCFFSKVLGYKSQEILLCPIDLLMTLTVAGEHSKSFHSWVDDGKCGTSSNYHIRKVYLKHKKGNIIGADKYLKSMITPENQLQYVALFRISKEEENVIVIDEEMNVEGMTTQLALNLGFPQSIHLSSFNLLLICPCLLKYSIFNESLSTLQKSQFMSENQIQMKQEQNRLSRFRSNKITGLSNKRVVKTASSHSQSETKTKVNPKISADFLRLSQCFNKDQYHQKPLKDKFSIIKKALFQNMNNNAKDTRNFDCQILIKPKTIQNKKYYEIQFTSVTHCQSQKSFILTQNQRKRHSINIQMDNFHRQFEKNFDYSYSLQSSNNVFMKQENNSPLKELYHINLLRNMLRLVFSFISIISVISFIFNTFHNFNQYVEISQEIVAINDLDLHLLELETSLYRINYYNPNQSNPPSNNITLFNQSIYDFDLAYTDIMALKQDKYLKKCIFNKKTNPYLTFNQSLAYQNLTQNVTYDEVDLIFKFFQSAEQIQSKGFQNYTFGDSRESVFLQSFLLPSFTDLAQNIKVSLSAFADSIIKDVDIIIICIYLIEAAILTAGFVLAVFRITRIMQSFIVMIQVFTEFHVSEIEKISKYSIEIYKRFKRLMTKHREQLSIPIEQEHSQQDHSNNNTTFLLDHNTLTESNNNISKNKKIKKISIGLMFTKVSIQTYGLIIFSFILFAGGYFFLNSRIDSNNAALGKLYDMGSHHFKFYSTVARIQLAIQRKFYNETLYNSQFASLFQSDINQLLTLKNKEMRIDPEGFNFQFITLYNKAMKQNVCQLMLTNSSQIKECESAAKTAFKFGIESFILYYTNDALNYLNSTISLGYSQILEFSQAVNLYNRFIQNLSDYWIQDVKKIVKDFKGQIVQSVLGVTFGLLLFYLVFGQLFIVKNLNSQYNLMRRVYLNFMPDYLITKEKIIKAELIQKGILHK